MADLIERQAAIDEIDEWIKAFRENGHKESAADACLIQNGIIQLPSAQPEPQWTPCSEKLPENICQYIVTDFEGDVEIAWYRKYRRGDEEIPSWWLTEYERINVYAWMPLPEPYKERREE